MSACNGRRCCLTCGIDSAGQRTDSPFQARELFGSSFAEIVVKKAVNDGIDGGVEAREVARDVEQRAEPARNLFNYFKLTLKHYFFYG